MFSHYFKIAIRNFLRNRLNTFINILGLTVSISIFILIIRYVQNEFSTDSFHENLGRLYRVENVDFSSSCSAGFKDLVLANYSEIEDVVRFCPMSSTMISYAPEGDAVSEKKINVSNMICADSTFFDLFSFKLLLGDPRQSLNKTFTVVLTQSTASTLFGDENPLGKSVLVNNDYKCMITGVVEDCPQNSSVAYGGLISMVTLGKRNGPEFLQNMNNWFYATYALLGKGQDHVALEKRISEDVSQQFTGGSRETPFKLRPLSTIYFNQHNYPSDYSKHGKLQFVYVFLAVAIIIILIAIINFINISTATASSRAREVGVRKVVGSSRISLIRQFLGETVLLSLISVILAVMLAELIKPEFNNVVGQEISIGYLENPIFLVYLLAGALFIGIIAGLYPAFYMTSFQPVLVMKGNITRGSGGATLRRLLLIIQFIISTALIIGTLLIVKQINFLKNRHLGFNGEQVVYFDLNRELLKKKDVLKGALDQNSNVQEVSYSTFSPGGMGGDNYTRLVEGTRRTFYYIMTDPSFVDVIDLELVAGRNFHSDSKAEIGSAIILNETAVKTFELENPLGTRIELFDTVGTVVGVVKDFHFKSLHEEVEPISILYLPDWSGSVLIKINTSNVPETMAFIEETCKDMSMDFTMDYKFLDDGFDALYKSEEKFATLIVYFSVLAIFIACLGLYGLVSFTATQRKKEISIRKVNGASVGRIIFMLNKEISTWVLIAFVLACPLAWFLMDQWLQNFALRTSISWWIFIASGLISLAIAILTMGYIAFRAASGNPVDGLRTE
nr:ABC transporter permease [Bacteroidota bacterium]